MGPIAAPEGVRSAPCEVVRVVVGVSLEPLSARRRKVLCQRKKRATS